MSCRRSKKTRCLPRPRFRCFTPTSRIRNWTSFQKLGVSSVYSPGCYHARFTSGLAGQHRRVRVPDANRRSRLYPHDEDALQAWTARARSAPHGPLSSCLPRLSRRWSATSATNWRARWAPGGFDPARDITAITVNRWPHGYAYEYNSLWDDFWLNGGETPCEVARKPFGRIAIANADAGAYAYTDCAIDQAWRAVGEITKISESSWSSATCNPSADIAPACKAW